VSAYFARRIIDCKMLKYKRYKDFLDPPDSSCRVRDMINQHHSAQQWKTRVTKKLGDLGQQYPEFQEILTNPNGTEKWIPLPAIVNQTSRDPMFAKRCLNCTYVNHPSRLNRKSKLNKWYTSGHILEGIKRFDNGCSQLDE